MSTSSSLRIGKILRERFEKAKDQEERLLLERLVEKHKMTKGRKHKSKKNDDEVSEDEEYQAGDIILDRLARLY